MFFTIVLLFFTIVLLFLGVFFIIWWKKYGKTLFFMLKDLGNGQNLNKNLNNLTNFEEFYKNITNFGGQVGNFEHKMTNIIKKMDKNRKK